jgi:hypothetical protein
MNLQYPQASRQWGWQYDFPAACLSVDQRSGVTRRHHLSGDFLQGAVKAAIRRAQISKGGSCV